MSIEPYPPRSADEVRLTRMLERIEHKLDTVFAKLIERKPVCIETATIAIRDEVGSRLCRMNDDGKRSCHGPVCLCRDAACAALSAAGETQESP